MDGQHSASTMGITILMGKLSSILVSELCAECQCLFACQVKEDLAALMKISDQDRAQGGLLPRGGSYVFGGTVCRFVVTKDKATPQRRT